MAWLQLLKLFTGTWNTPEHSSKGQVRLMSAQVMLMMQNMQLYERGGRHPHPLADLRLVLGEARPVAGPLVRTGASFLIQTTCTPLWVPHLAGRARNSRSAIVLPLPCYQSYRTHSPLLVTAARHQLPLLLAALHKFVRWPFCHFSYIIPTPDRPH